MAELSRNAITSDCKSDVTTLPVWESRLFEEGDIQGSQSPDNRYFDEADTGSPESLSKLDNLDDVFTPGVSDNTGILLPPPESVVLLSNLPVLDEKTQFPGTYDFRISFELQKKKITKSTSWTYSEKGCKLYAQPNQRCPIRCGTSSSPPAGAYVRCTVVYSQQQYRAEVVERCLNHSMQNTSDQHPKHLFRCYHLGVVYEKSTSSGYLSTTSPYMYSEDWNTYYYEVTNKFFITVFDFVYL